MIDVRKLAIPWVLIVPMLGGALVAGGAWATNKSNTAELEKRVEADETRATHLEERSLAHDIEHEGMKHDLAHLVEAIDRIEDRMGTHK